jgi:hypothetical protein
MVTVAITFIFDGLVSALEENEGRELCDLIFFDKCFFIRLD